MEIIHQLWETHEWASASEEEVIAALFNAPQFIDPRDMAEINKYKPGAKKRYLNLFYLGDIPPCCKKLNRL